MLPDPPYPYSQSHLASYAGKRVLITGGLGFIGSNLAIRLLDLGADVLLVDALIRETGGNPFNIEPVKDSSHVSVRTVDVRDVLAMERLVDGRETMFNLAGQVSHLDSMRDPFTDLEISCRSQLALLEVCRSRAPTTKLVFASTRQIYGRVSPMGLPINERQIPNPVMLTGSTSWPASDITSSTTTSTACAPVCYGSPTRTVLVCWFVTTAKPSLAGSSDRLLTEKRSRCLATASSCV